MTGFPQPHAPINLEGFTPDMQTDVLETLGQIAFERACMQVLEEASPEHAEHIQSLFEASPLDPLTIIHELEKIDPDFPQYMHDARTDLAHEMNDTEKTSMQLYVEHVFPDDETRESLWDSAKGVVVHDVVTGVGNNTPVKEPFKKLQTSLVILHGQQPANEREIVASYIQRVLESDHTVS